MQVIINARFLTQSVTGVQRYAIELVRTLDRLIDAGEIDKCISFTMVSPRGIRYDLDLKHIPIKQIGRLRGHLWEQIELPFYARGGLLVSLCNAAPLSKHNQIVTIHDASVFASPETYPFGFREWYKILLRGIGKTARKIVTDSHFSKSELIRLCGMPESKICAIHLSAEHLTAISTDESILDKHNIRNRPFLLAVSSLNPNKNFHSIVEAISMLDIDCDIVIAGGVNPRVFSKTTEPLPESIKYLGYVEDSELRALYQYASCFIYPSFYEGFGLPPLEAMACGCPVIVSNAASLPEVCGDAALYCNPHSPKDIASKISQLIKDPALQDVLRRKGLERAEQFTWEKTARETLNIIEQAALG